MEQEQNTKDESQYKSIFKATTLFGGVQVWNMLIGIVRSKLVAMILGPYGMGITGLFTSSTELVRSCTNFGLSTSGVKYISEANSQNGFSKASRVASIFRKLMWLTGLLGMAGVIIFSPYLSRSAFGDSSYIVAFLFLSVTLLLQQLSAGYLVELQGFHHLRSLAKASVIGSVLGLVITIPLYYVFGVSGIVPVLIIASATSLFLNWYFAQKIKLEKVKTTFKEAIKEGKGMIVMGVAMTLTGILETIAAYVIRIYVANKGGTEEVGFYTAGMTILNTYVGMIFTAMTTDYFPRLSAISKDNSKSKILVNQQAEIALIALGLILPAFIAAAPLAIIVLYSDSFLPTVKYLQWGCLGVIFKALSWAISYMFIAKGEMKTFVMNETVAKVFSLGSALLGYSLWGLEGLGIAYMVAYFLYLSWVYMVSRKKYDFHLSSSLFKILLLTLFFSISIFLITYFIQSSVKYIFASVFFIVGFIIMLRELNKRIELNELKNRLLHKKQ